MASDQGKPHRKQARPGATRPSSPDLILLNGKVFTSDPARRYAQAVAIAGDRILAVGATDEIAAMADARTRRVELDGRTVIPGINDAHFHHTPDPRATMLPFSSMEPTWEEVLESVSAAVKQAPKGSWILGIHGINVVNDPRATRFELDRVAPEHPVRLNPYFGHGSVLNTRAMAALDMSEEEPDPLGGCCERVEGSKRVTGKLFGYAQWRPWSRLAREASDADAIDSAKQLAQEAIRFGVTSMQNMSLMATSRYVRVLQQAELPIRIRVIRFPATGLHTRNVNEGRDLPVNSSPRVTVTGTKWLLDGTPLERRAAQRTEYRDRPGWSGQFYLPENEMRAMLRESLENNDPLLVHAVGDKTAESFLNAMEAEAKQVEWKTRRVRIEHGDGLLPDLIPRARDLGVIVVQNPSHFAFNEILIERYGEPYDYVPVRSLIETGIPFALGSDGPLNPYLNIMFASIHPARPSEAITVEQAVEAYTRGSAYAEFQEAEKGTLAPGKLADLAVLSQDIFTVPAGYLPGTQSVLTMVGGEIVHNPGTLAVFQ
ncbi:MAG TPA: amidohydrolase [Candidatus Binataceae bacterium]